MPLLSRFPQIRSWNEFFTNFKQPKNFQERVATNLSYYAGNYLFIVLMCLMLSLFLHPKFALILTLVLVFGYILKQYLKANKLGRQKKTQLAQIYLIIGLIISIIFGLLSILYGLGFGALLILIHATLRKRSIKSKVVKFVDFQFDFGVISSLIDYLIE